MKVFNCILGILTVLASIYCIFYPGLTFLNVGWIVTIILGLWGISSIISYAASRNDGNNKEKALMGTLGLIAGIAAAVVSVLAMFMPGIRVMFDILILAIFAVWLIVDGISSIATSFKVKNQVQVYGYFRLYAECSYCLQAYTEYLILYSQRKHSDCLWAFCL